MAIHRMITAISCMLIVVSISVDCAFAKQAGFKERFVGSWDANKEKTKTYASEHEDSKAFPADVLDSMPSMTLKILESGDASVEMKEMPNGESMTLKGDWEVHKEVDENNAQVTINMNVGDREDSKIAKAEFEDDDTLILTFDDEPTIVFLRSKEDSKSKGDASGDK